MNKSIKHDDVLRFIELYKNHEVLWNMNLWSYRRNDLKRVAYEEIGEEMNMTVDEVKKKIKSLRTAYGAERAKVAKSRRSGKKLYVPTVFWYNDMTFINASRLNVDDSKQEYVTTVIERSYGSEADEESGLESSYAEEESRAMTPYSKRIKCSPGYRTKVDEASDEICTAKDATMFETFGENVARQIMVFPEEEAYQIISDIEHILSKKKMIFARKKREGKSEKSRVQVLKSKIICN